MSIQSGTVVAIRPGPSGESKQGLGYFVGVSAQTAGSVGLCAHLITIPAGGRARAHLHEGHETAIYMLEGGHNVVRRRTGRLRRHEKGRLHLHTGGGSSFADQHQRD